MKLYQHENSLPGIPQRTHAKNVQVIKSLTRSYGYTLQWIGNNPPSWILGPNHTWAWYRYKKHALEAASRYN